MIKYVEGDILLSEVELLAHGVAPGDHFDQGLALSLRERWPAMAKDFRHWCHLKNPKSGEVWHWAGAGGTRIACLLTQESAEKAHKGHPGKAKSEYVNHALRDLRQLISDEGIKSIALPKLATGVGGMDWETVKELIESHLGDLEIPVYVYQEFHKGQKAEEPELAGQS